MILALFLPNGECHINSYRQSNGNYITVCGVIVDKSCGTTTLTVDDSFPGICRYCKDYYDDVYKSNLEHSPANARGLTVSRLTSTLDHNRLNLDGPETQYYGIEDRLWYRLSRWKRLIPNYNKKKKNTKFRFKFIK